MYLRDMTGHGLDSAEIGQLFKVGKIEKLFQVVQVRFRKVWVTAVCRHGQVEVGWWSRSGSGSRDRSGSDGPVGQKEADPAEVWCSGAGWPSGVVPSLCTVGVCLGG